MTVWGRVERCTFVSRIIVLNLCCIRLRERQKKLRMKTRPPALSKTFQVALLLLPGVPAFAASVVATFDGGVDSMYTLQGFGDPAFGGPPTIQPAGGNPGGFLQITAN